MKTRRASSEHWTRVLSRAEAKRRGLYWVDASWTERFVRESRGRQRVITRKFDLAGCLDAVLLGDGETIGLQYTSYYNVPARVRKIRSSPAFDALLRAGWRLLVWGWDQRGSEPKLREESIS